MSLYVPYYRPYNKHNTNIHALGGIRTRNPSKRAVPDPRLRQHGHWDRQGGVLPLINWALRHEYLHRKGDIAPQMFNFVTWWGCAVSSTLPLLYSRGKSHVATGYEVELAPQNGLDAVKSIISAMLGNQSLDSFVAHLQPGHYADWAILPP
jgi:hypothetical protein